MAKRKKQITYDSKETSTIIGLISILAATFFFISIISTSQDQNDLFSQARSLFGQSTLFTVFFLFSLGLHFLGANFSFTTTKSLISQAILCFLIPGLLTSFSTTPRELIRLTGLDVLGGQIGYFVVQDIFSDTVPTQPGTRIILFLSVLIALPVAFSLSLNQLLKYLWGAVKLVIPKKRELNDTFKKGGEQVEKASTFGDFNKLLKQKQQIEKDAKDKKQDMKSIIDQPARIQPKKRDSEGVEIQDAGDWDNGLKQEYLKYSGWKLPPLNLLIPYKKTQTSEPAINQNANIIRQTLHSFGIEAEVEEAFIGPSVIQYALNIPLGVKVEKISNLSANLALALGVDSKAVRIESILDTTFLGIEVPRSVREMVRLKELMESEYMVSNKMALPVPIGKNIDGSAVVADIQKMPHLLIAGATGSGKSVLTNAFITSLLMRKTPDELKLILVDPKMVEMSDYNGIPHLITEVITNMEDVVHWLKWCVAQMEERYKELAREQVRNIQSYNEKKGYSAMPYIVIVIDEMADMMMTANRVETETSIVRLAQKARAVGIHLILATQRPSVNIITGIIKANIPGRVGMSVTSSTDSRVILDRIGAESLFGNGDLLYKAPDKVKSIRLQGAFVDQSEVGRIVDFIKSQAPVVEYIKTEEIKQAQISAEDSAGNANSIGREGSLLEQAIRIAVQYQKGSSSFLQRKLNIGFNKAAELVDKLESLGVVGPQNGSKPREVLVGDAESFLQSLRNGGGEITESV